MENQITSIISFSINEELFALDTLKVRHILEMENITKVPNTKAYLLGVIKLHGNIIPVVDLRLMMGISRPEITADTAIIVVSHDDNNASLIGMVVDNVKEVVSTEASKLKETVFDGSTTGLISSFEGTIHEGDNFIHVINLNEVINQIEN